MVDDKLKLVIAMKALAQTAKQQEDLLYTLVQFLIQEVKEDKVAKAVKHSLVEHGLL